MKKFIYCIILLFSICLSSNSKVLSSTLKSNYFYGEEYSEIFNYTLVCNINESNKKDFYSIGLLHFLPSYNDGDIHNDNKGVVEKKGKLLIKLNNDEILTFNFENKPCKYFPLDGYEYYIMSIYNIDENNILKIINIGVKKIRVSTDLLYIDLKSNIFSKLKEGYDNIETQYNTLIGKKSIYDNF